jgi:hypothetical protein
MAHPDQSLSMVYTFADQIAQQECAWDAALQKVIDGLKVKASEPRPPSARGLRGTAEHLLEYSRVVFDSFQALRRSAVPYQRILARTPDFFEEAAQAFEGQSQEETHPTLKKSYAAAAQAWRDKAARARKKRVEMRDFTDEKTVAFVTHLNQLLEELIPTLKYTEAVDGPPAAMVQDFSEFRTQLDQFLKTMEEAQSHHRSSALDEGLRQRALKVETKNQAKIQPERTARVDEETDRRMIAGSVRDFLIKLAIFHKSAVTLTRESYSAIVASAFISGPNATPAEYPQYADPRDYPIGRQLTVYSSIDLRPLGTATVVINSGDRIQIQTDGWDFNDRQGPVIFDKLTEKYISNSSKRAATRSHAHQDQ